MRARCCGQGPKAQNAAQPRVKNQAALRTAITATATVRRGNFRDLKLSSCVSLVEYTAPKLRSSIGSLTELRLKANSTVGTFRSSLVYIEVMWVSLRPRRRRPRMAARILGLVLLAGVFALTSTPVCGSALDVDP